MQNSVGENLSLGKQSLPPTSKKDNLRHGLGLQQIKRLTEQHQGELLLTCEDLIFSTELMLKYHSYMQDRAKTAQ